jgi:hypothetical protein
VWRFSVAGVLGGCAGCGSVACGGVGCVLFLVFPRRLVAFAPVMGVPVRGWRPGVTGLLVENCIVDASILKRSNF